MVRSDLVRCGSVENADSVENALIPAPPEICVACLQLAGLQLAGLQQLAGW
jgi:hypothetical protein